MFNRSFNNNIRQLGILWGKKAQNDKGNAFVIFAGKY